MSAFEKQKIKNKIKSCIKENYKKNIFLDFGSNEFTLTVEEKPILEINCLTTLYNCCGILDIGEWNIYESIFNKFTLKRKRRVLIVAMAKYCLLQKKLKIGIITDSAKNNTIYNYIKDKNPKKGNNNSLIKKEFILL